jgi:two-component system sensor histidine kinase PilS (NtrC family)
MDSRPDLDHRRDEISQLPDARAVLGWIYLGRLLLAVALLVAGAAGAQVRYGTALPVLALVLLGFTAASYEYSHRRNGALGASFRYLQLVGDALLISAAVAFTGAEDSIFSPLYVLLICAAALLLPRLSGILVGLLGIAFYLAIVVRSSAGSPGAFVALQIALFAVVALVTGYLGDRLRAAGAALGEVTTELQQLRLDTGDILNTVSSGILTVDGEGRLAYLNPAAEEILSLSAPAWTGRPILDRLDGIAPGLGTVILRSARDHVAVRRFETDAVADDLFVLGVSTTLVERDDLGTPAVTAIFQDITERKRHDALRRRAERLEAVAELSASLAHEIKNPLASIRSAVEQIADGRVDPEDARVLRTLVVRESDRLSRLLTEFIDFARVKVTAPRPVDFLALVENVVHLVRAHPDAQGRTIDLSLASAPSAVWIRGGEDLLHRAVLNLVLNGAQWAGSGGVVRLVVDEVRSDLLSPSLGALSLIRLTVSDSGPGIPDAIVEHIFNPFFTRRAGGTGLGLALVQRAVEAHGGAIFVDNGPAASGIGAVFSLYLPAHAASGPADAEIPANEESTPL